MIKRILTCLLLATAYLSATQAADVVTILPDQSFYLLPAELSKDGKAFVYNDMWVDNETRTKRFHIYDDDFQMTNEVVTIPGTPNSYSYQTQIRKSIPIEARIWNEDRRSEPFAIDGVTSNLSIQMVWQNMPYPSEWEISTLIDGTPIVAYLPYYYEVQSFDKKYPQLYYKKEVDGLWYLYEVRYDTIYGPYGEWEEAETHETVEYHYIVEVKIIPLDGSDEQWYELTRGIFAEDFCYVLPEYKKVDFNKEYTYADTDWVYKKEWGFKSEIRAFYAYDSANKIVATFDIPEGYKCNNSDYIQFLRLNQKRYILIDIEKPDTKEYGEDYTVIYRLDDNNKVTQVTIAPSTKVSPRAPRQGELVTVTFDESSIASPKTVDVVSASGQTVYRTKLPAGQSSINLDTSRLNQGMYLVTVLTDGKSQEAAKIIVR